MGIGKKRMYGQNQPEIDTIGDARAKLRHCANLFYSIQMDLEECSIVMRVKKNPVHERLTDIQIESKRLREELQEVEKSL